MWWLKHKSVRHFFLFKRYCSRSGCVRTTCACDSRVGTKDCVASCIRACVLSFARLTVRMATLIFGEPQILGQVKEAYAVAGGVGAVHSNLNGVITRAFAVAKRVRNDIFFQAEDGIRDA